MSYSFRPVLLAILYLFNFGVIASLLAAAFFLSQGLFGDLYSCNERTIGVVDRIYDFPVQPAWTLQLCLVDLNYTASASDDDPQSYYALHVGVPCSRLLEEDNMTTTNLCYNRYHPEYFASVTGGDDLATDYTHDEAMRDMDLGFKAALWMALLGFLASGLHRHMDSIDSNLTALQEWGLQGLKHARCKSWREELYYSVKSKQQ